SAGLGTWQPVAGWQPWLVAVFALIFTLGYTILSLPLSYYQGFVLPGRYGLRTQALGGWLADQAKGVVLSLIFLVVVVEVLYLLLATQPQTWWLWLAGIALVFTVLLANLAPVLLLPLFYKMTPMPEGELRTRLLAMADKAHTKVRGVFVMGMSQKTTEGNAALMGLGNTRRIVVGDTIIRDFAPDEIEVVLAHELGHHVHNDIAKLIATQTVLTVGGLALVNVGLQAIVGNATAGLHTLADVATLPVLAALLGLYSFVTGPLGNTLSRAIEHDADQYALETTHDPAAFSRAFYRLANQNLAQLDPNPIIEALFYDHPAISKRLRHAEEWQQANH
ncbi:MAG: M48 family metallopeptidase, partial [Ktedonobacterales bacterium]|nr:M48 family metallopeptidase [Ktedonobacterales bacterium]